MRAAGFSKAPSSTYRRLWAVVERIPAGRVATYGQVAALAGLPGRARQAGYALHALPDGADVPWHRVINARGEISRRSEPCAEGYQRHLLEEEGVRFVAGRVDLARFGWEPDAAPEEIAARPTAVAGSRGTARAPRGRPAATRRAPRSGARHR